MTRLLQGATDSRETAELEDECPSRDAVDWMLERRQLGVHF
jgi:hypothetical protein